MQGVAAWNEADYRINMKALPVHLQTPWPKHKWKLNGSKNLTSIGFSPEGRPRTRILRVVLFTNLELNPAMSER